MQRIKIPEAKILPSGSWRCRVKMPDADRKSFTAQTKAEAEKQAADYVARYLAGVEEVKAKYDTVGACVNRYIDSRRNVLSPSTIRGYVRMRKYNFQPAMDLNIHEITRQQWQTLVNLEAKNYSPKSVRNAWGLMSSVIKDETGASVDVQLPKAAENHHPFLDDEQVKIFMELIKDTDIEAACLLGLHSLRLSEILALKWKGIDQKKKTITVKGALVMGEESKMIERDQNKTKQSTRVVPIIMPRLLELAAGKPKEENVAPFTDSQLYRAINAVCEANDLPKIGVHGLRHTFASICFYKGIPEKAIMEMGGWSDPTILRDIYTHVSDRQKESYVKTLSEFFT